jgi:SAM-dependent methyltransferase
MLWTGAAAAQAQAQAPAQRPEVVFEPTPHETVARMLRLAEVGSGDVVIDLGSGDGRIPIAAGYLGARALGIELDPALVDKSRAAAKSAGLASRVTFRQEDLFKTPLDGATVITLYLLPEMNERLRPRLLALRPGTRIVAHLFAIAGWKPDVIDDNGGRVFLWYVPADVAGTWQLRHGRDQIALELKQQFQEISGSATIAGRTLALREPVLRGGEIEFTLVLGGRQTRFRGTVSGNKMKGAGGGFGFQSFSGPWTATR